jgi:Holliday junction resolvase RusA-like endonuclease
LSEPITIVMLGEPVPWAHRSTRSGIRYTPTEQKNATAALRMAAEQATYERPLFTLFDEPVRFEILAEMPIPRSWSRRKQQRALLGEIRPAVRPDGSNIQKLVEDALSGIVYRDDALIVEWQGRKIYGLQPKLVITVTPMATSAQPAERKPTAPSSPQRLGWAHT